MLHFPYKRLFKCYVMQWICGGIQITADQRYEGVQSNVISITRGLGDVQNQEKALRNT